MVFLDIISAVFIFGGLFFFAVGVIGLLRLPDVYNRLHATTKCDTLGAGLALVGLALQAGELAAIIKLLLIIVLLWICNPTAGHTIAKAAYNSGIPLVHGSFELDSSSKEDRS